MTMETDHLWENWLHQFQKISPPNFPESGNSGLKINNSLNAHSSWQEYARTKIQLPSEISDSDLSLKAKKCMCSFKTVGGVCLWSCNELGNIYKIPGVMFGLPHETFGLPLVMFGLPLVTFGLPHVMFGLPDVTFGLPHVTFGLPNVTCTLRSDP